ncbi:FMN-binding glutamate synthase family protein [Puniceicoccus vermicola]|uniref:FMN-binding glutamate synthase family protein n=1 Tax=Puniceicoccus vermicola TaxID=388746 RepID=A0A7X1E6U3_9BACT|nr:FMN-binding glutamate synthase family protein [Puniceicoccus vermicola]MBC2603007.1 FMN-binding glutamate synthase family protein [Puniceicoccus vermicola]
MRKLFVYISIGLILGIAIIGFFASAFLWCYVVVLPLVGLGVYDMFQSKHTILRNFPVLGYFRYFFELISPEIQQYFIERHTDGTPISRNHRTIVYERAKDVSATHPFGTELDLYNNHYEGLKHSIYAKKPSQENPRVQIGGPQCEKPYSASIYNISAMSFGALSSHAILAMNKGAKSGGFYHNTGEGALSDYHLEGGGDIVWQIGTGYFGCRNENGDFDPDAFIDKAKHQQVKMIELKLSQGAKPGHGGVLPAAKNNEEIAKVRMVEPHTTVLSPPGHSEFNDAEGLLRFVDRLRSLSGGKPTGFKLCIGRETEFEELCDTMKSTGIHPDFITVDGAEGGTGAAPLEYSDSVGMPLEPALKFVRRTLEERGLHPEIKIIASGKIVTAAQLVKILSIGADLCNAARAFMLAVGCIQAQRCDTNNCPTGVATQKPELIRGLVVEEKYRRVANFHRNTIKATMELMASCGVEKLEDLSDDLFMHGWQWPPEGGTRAG